MHSVQRRLDYLDQSLLAQQCTLAATCCTISHDPTCLAGITSSFASLSAQFRIDVRQTHRTAYAPWTMVRPESRPGGLDSPWRCGGDTVSNRCKYCRHLLP